VQPECHVQVQFHAPPAELRRYFTTFYLVELTVAAGCRVTDHLHPEWANLRFVSGDLPDAEAHGGTVLSHTNFCVTGPSSHTVRVEQGSARMWGIGLLPLGWARFVGVPAVQYADSVIDGNTHPAFSAFTPLAATLFGAEPDPAAELARISDHFLARPAREVPDEARILAIHGALIDPDLATVSQLVERTGGSLRTIERACARAFGFSPKLLLRRQRFMRSLAQYLLDPSLKWIGAIDGHYHDQAQFVRDFKQFVGMSPRQYAALDKPIIGAVMHARARFAGHAVQALDRPEGGAAR